MQCFGPVGPSSDIQCWTLCTLSVLYRVKDGLRDQKLWSCVHLKIRLFVCKHPRIIYLRNLCPRDLLFKIQTTIKYEGAILKGTFFQKTYESALLEEVSIALGEIIYLIIIFVVVKMCSFGRAIMVKTMKVRSLLKEGSS